MSKTDEKVDLKEVKQMLSEISEKIGAPDPIPQKNVEPGFVARSFFRASGRVHQLGNAISKRVDSIRKSAAEAQRIGQEHYENKDLRHIAQVLIFNGSDDEEVQEFLKENQITAKELHELLHEKGIIKS